MRDKLQKWLGIHTMNKEVIMLGERLRELEAQYDDLKYETENNEYRSGELEMRIDEIEEIDIQSLKDSKEELNRVVDEFESMKDGYTISVKLKPPLTY